MNVTTGASGIPPVLVISLQSSVERRARMAAQLEQLGIAFRFIDGVVGVELTAEQVASVYNSRKRQLLFGKDLTPGELGCLLGHRRAYETMIAENMPAALVLEDDAIVSNDLVPVLQALGRLDRKWDVIRFLCRPKNYKESREIVPLTHTHDLTRVCGLPGGAYGYLLSLHAAEVLLMHTHQAWMPVDTLQGYTGLTGLDVYAVKPSPVFCNDDVPSTIGEARFDRKKQIDGFWRYLYPFTRFAMKVYEFFFKLKLRLTVQRDRRALIKNSSQQGT